MQEKEVEGKMFAQFKQHHMMVRSGWHAFEKAQSKV